MSQVVTSLSDVAGYELHDLVELPGKCGHRFMHEFVSRLSWGYCLSGFAVTSVLMAALLQ